MLFRVILSVRKLLFLAILGSLGTLPGFATIIRLDFKGTIQTSDFGSLSVGTAFSGFVYYDTAATPFDVATGSSLAAAAYLIPQTFLLNVGNSTVTPDASSLDQSQVQVVDRFESQPQPPGALDSIVFHFDGFKINGPLAADVPTLPQPGLFLSFIGSPAALDSVQLPESFPDLATWNNFSPDTLLGLVTNPQPADVLLSFHGHLTSISSSAVPEPSYFLVIPFLLALAGWTTRRKRFL